MDVFLALLAPPVVSAAVAALVRPFRRWVAWCAATASLVSLGAAVLLCARVLEDDAAVTGIQSLRVDALSALLALCIAFVAALASWLGPGIGRDGGGYDGGQLRRFTIFTSVFTLSMLVAVTTNNVGFLWIAIEATTLASAVLIPLHVTKASVEASWKYVLLGSVGISLAFAGTVLAYFALVQQGLPGEAALNWTTLMAAAPELHPEIMKLAFVFLLVGYGTKAAVAPMHTWLPDAYAEAPPPVAAMMSGVLMATAMYAIMRWKAVVDRAVSPAFSGHLLIGLGVLSVAVASLSLVLQRNYKRMLAYSSVEHSGLICIGLGLGPAGVFAATFHLVNHAVVKSMLFLLSGRIGRRYGTAQIREVSGLMATMPATAVLFGLGVFALVGLPPGSLFLSEYALVGAGFRDGRPWLMALVLALLFVAFVALVRHVNRMLFGPAPASAPPAGVGAPGERDRLELVPLAVCALLLVGLGLIMPAPLLALLGRIAAGGVR